MGLLARLHHLPRRRIGGWRGHPQQMLLRLVDPLALSPDIRNRDFRTGRYQTGIGRDPAIREGRGLLQSGATQRVGKLRIAFEREAAAIVRQMHFGLDRYELRIVGCDGDSAPGRAGPVGFETDRRDSTIERATVALVFLLPFGIAKASDAQQRGARNLIEGERPRDDDRRIEISAAHFQRHRGQVVLAGLGCSRMDHFRKRAAQRDGKLERCREIDSGGFIELDSGGKHGPRDGAHHNRHQPGTADAQRQHLMERRGIPNVGEAGPAAGAVEPQGFPTDRRADQDMIEGARAGQPLLQQIAELAARQHRLCLDPHRVEDGEQQQGLGLAVAIAQRPGLGWRLRHVIARIHALEQIPNLVLDKLQSKRRALHRIGFSRGDLRDLGGQGAAWRDQPVRGEERGHDLRDRIPAVETGRLDHWWPLEACRRVGGHFRLLRERKGQGQFAIATSSDDLGRGLDGV
ncbi:MAG: hypothetical protein ABI240_19405, partial [Sphingomonas sp.]